MERKHNDEEKLDSKKKLMVAVVIIIILFSLVTSCSCTSNFFGKIGDIFRSEGDFPIDDDSGEQEIIKNQELKFDVDNLEISLSDAKSKLSFSYKSITPKEFTCSTSDATIATCYVEDGHVVLNPKKVGLVTVILEAKTNGKVYQATSEVTITDSDKSISLDSESGTINLAYSKTKIIAYNLIGLSGQVEVTSSDESVAKATISNGTLNITGLKTGRATITLSITYNGQTYETSYKLNVINKVNSQNNNNDKVKDSDSFLKNLTINNGKLSFNSNTLSYNVGVNWWNSKVTLKATPKSSKAKLTYYFNGQSVASLSNLRLNKGDNKIGITVTAEDGSTTVYTVIVNKPPFKNNYLKTIETNKGTLTPKFDKNILNYEIQVNKKEQNISLTVEKKRPSSTVTYTYNGRQVNSLDNLPLEKNENDLVITVVAESGEIRTYNVKIKASDNEEGLKDLVISTGNLKFDANTSTYRVGVSSSTDKVSLTAMANSTEANVTYTFNESEVYSLDDLVLNNGDNEVVITVTTPNGESKVYTVIINKALPTSSNSLENITSTVGTLNPAFDKDTLSYKIDVDNATKNISLNVIPVDKTSNVTYTFNGIALSNLNDLSLKEGTNTVLITVTAEDGTKRVYEININREESTTEKDSDSSLSNITLSNGTLTPEFSSTTISYVVNVENSIDKIKVEAFKNSDKAKVEYTFGTDTFTDSKDIPLSVGENILKITVTAEDDSKTEYTVKINRDNDKNNYLTEIKPNIGKLSPEFTADTYNYRIDVDSSTSKIDLSIDTNNPNVNMTYKLGEEELTSLKGINLAYGKNSITITLENGKTYTIDVYRKSQSDNNYLSNITGVNNFKKEITDYSIYVDENTTSVSFGVTKEDSKATIEYYLDGQKVDSISTVELSKDSHMVEIVVVAENGNKRTYTISIEKSKPFIEFTKDSYEFDLENDSYSIGYKVLDDNGNEMDYKTSDISIDIPDFNGSISIKKNVIELSKIDGTFIDKTYTMTVKIGNSSDTATLSFKMKEYTASAQKNNYELTLTSTQVGTSDIIVNTNMFTGTKIDVNPNGSAIEICSEDSNRCITVTNENSNTISLEYTGEKSDVSSLVFKATAKNSGDASIKVVAKAFNKDIASFTIDVKVTKEFTVTIDPNGGEFNEFSRDPLINTYSEGKEIDLKDYKPYKIADDKGCTYYELESWTGSNGITYKLDGSATTKVTINSNLVFTANYSTKTIDKPVTEEKIMYLTEEKIFRDQEYFEKYGKDKEIYPGAEGSYQMNFENNSNSAITIKAIVLTEENVCPEAGKCLNMGYILKDKDKALLGELASSTNNNTATYRVLNEIASPQSQKTNTYEIPANITVDKKATGSVALLWKWVEKSDEVDTLIGTYVARKITDPTINDLYKLTVAVKYTTVNNACTSQN